MSDRQMDVDNIATAPWVDTGKYADGSIAFVEGPSDFVLSRYRRERVPSGGRALPKREKPFTNGTLIVQFPSGPLVRYFPDHGIYHHSTGPLSNVFTMRDSGKSLTGTLEFPMGGDKTPRADLGSIYPPGVNPDLLSQTEVKALNKLRGKSVEDQLNFGLVWAERHETVGLFKDGAEALLGLALALKRGKATEALDLLISEFRVNRNISRKQELRMMRNAIRASGRLLERMSSVVLTWNLGVSPLLQDLESASQLLKTGLLTKDWDIKSVARYSRTTNDVDRTSWPSTGVSSETTLAENHGYTVTLVAAPRLTTAALLSNLGLTNLPSLAYQATSLTFIVDYFYALGPWLDALLVPGDFEFKEGSWTQKVERVVTQSIRSSAGLIKGNYVLNYTRRKLYNTFPVPLPPLSLRERTLSEKQLLNTGLIALNKLKDLLSSPTLKSTL